MNLMDPMIQQQMMMSGQVPPTIGGMQGGMPVPRTMGAMDAATAQMNHMPAPAVAPEQQGLLARMGGGIKNFMGDPSRMAALTMGLNSMRQSPSAAIAATANQTIQRQAMKKQAENYANKTAEFLEKQGRKDMAEMVRRNPELGAQMLMEYQKAKLNPPDSFTQVRGSEIGMQGENADRLFNVDQTTGKISAIGGSSGGVTVNTGSDVGTIPAGYRVVRDANGQPTQMVPIEGSPAAIDAAADAEKAENRGEQTSRAGMTVIQDLQRMVNLIPDFTVKQGDDAGLGSKMLGGASRAALSNVYGTAEYQANLFKESALSNVGIDQLMQMKQNSPTGGALGAIPFQQQQRLEQLLGSLDVTQEPSILEDNANRIINTYLDIVHGSASQRQRLVEEGKISPEVNAEIESQYKTVSFDQSGNPIEQDLSQPPPDMSAARKAAWPNYSPEQKKLAWEIYNGR